MLAKPGRQSGGLIVGQDVNRPANGQIDQEQPKAQGSSVQRKIIHPQLWRRLMHTQLLVP
jgi:hypothetical protein